MGDQIQNTQVNSHWYTLYYFLSNRNSGYQRRTYCGQRYSMPCVQKVVPLTECIYNIRDALVAVLVESSTDQGGKQGSLATSYTQGFTYWTRTSRVQDSLN